MPASEAISRVPTFGQPCSRRSFRVLSRIACRVASFVSAVTRMTLYEHAHNIVPGAASVKSYSFLSAVAMLRRAATRAGIHPAATEEKNVAADATAISRAGV